MSRFVDRLEVEVTVGEQAIDVRVVGNIDIATVGEFRAVLWAQPPRPLLRLDLAGVPVLSAAAIRTLVAAHLGIRARGGTLVLVDPHPMVVRVLRAAGLHQVVPMVGRGTASALAQPQAGPRVVRGASVATRPTAVGASRAEAVARRAHAEAARPRATA